MNANTLTTRLRLGVLCAALVALCAVATGCATSEPRFRNIPNPDARLSQNAWNIWTRFLFARKEGTVPVDAIPLQRLDRAALDALDPAANHIIRLGHSSHLLKLRGKYWLIDPVFGERASPFSFLGPKRFHPSPIKLEQLPPIEGLILSHDHYDHLDVPTIEYLRERVERYFVPTGVGERLQEMGVAPARITELGWWQSGKHGDIGLTAAPAQHFSGRTLWDRDRTLWASWIVQSGSQRIFYSGDSGYFAGFKQIGERFGPFDVTLMENGAYDDYWPAVHMSPEESIQAFQDLRGKLLYGVHNTTFDLAFHRWQDPMERLTDLAEAKQLPIATPVIGEVLTVGQARTNVRWWKGLR
jgi:L-ascorbate metabolism protein UlaG (beta-lactamase superfamily)